MDSDILKQLSMSAGSAGNEVGDVVNLNGVYPTDRLTPKMARQAALIQYGHTNGVTVWDNEFNYGYRLYKNSARKLQAER